MPTVKAKQAAALRRRETSFYGGAEDIRAEPRENGRQHQCHGDDQRSLDERPPRIRRRSR